MIVRRNKENANGATLILTEPELIVLWHKLNCATGHTFNAYLADENLPDKTFRDVAGSLWYDLDRKFRPPGQ